jgi:hypothetical protein
MQQMQDIHLPATPGWWPPAFSWWVLLGTLLVVIVSGLLFLWRYRQFSQQRFALKRLQEIRGCSHDHCCSQERLERLSALLRRSAIAVSGRHGVSGLSGQNWLIWLDQFTDNAAFTQGVGSVLGAGHYQPTVEYDVHSLQNLVERTLSKMLHPTRLREFRKRKERRE